MSQLENLERVIIALPFSGNAQTFINKAGSIAWTAFKSFEEYKNDNQKLDLRVVSWDEYHELHANYFKQPFTEITEDQYDRALGELPPLKWHNITKDINVFFCSEPTSGLFHSCYIYNKSTNKYYSGMKKITSTDADLLNWFELETKQ